MQMAPTLFWESLVPEVAAALMSSQSSRVEKRLIYMLSSSVNVWHLGSKLQTPEPAERLKSDDSRNLQVEVKAEQQRESSA